MADGDQLPDGICEANIRSRGWHRHANPAALILLTLLLGAALLGLFGGHPNPVQVIETPEARVTLNFPRTLRNGEFFEMRANVVAKRPIGDAVLAISTDYWRDLTVNTMIPAATEEKSSAGEYRFSWGPLEAGETLTVKIDGQVNPPLFRGTAGHVAIMDGERTLGRAAMQLKVWP